MKPEKRVSLYVLDECKQTYSIKKSLVSAVSHIKGVPATFGPSQCLWMKSDPIVGAAAEPSVISKMTTEKSGSRREKKTFKKKANPRETARRLAIEKKWKASNGQL
jgi:hypothetical protein